MLSLWWKVGRGLQPGPSRAPQGHALHTERCCAKKSQLCPRVLIQRLLFPPEGNLLSSAEVGEKQAHASRCGGEDVKSRLVFAVNFIIKKSFAMGHFKRTKVGGMV